MIDQVCLRLAAGCLYVNRNIIGAVVGVQPFGVAAASPAPDRVLGGPLDLEAAALRAKLAGLARAAGVRRAALNPADDLAEALARSGRRRFAELVDAAARGFAIGHRDRGEGPGRRAKRLYAGRAGACSATPRPRKR